MLSTAFLTLQPRDQGAEAAVVPQNLFGGAAEEGLAQRCDESHDSRVHTDDGSRRLWLLKTPYVAEIQDFRSGSGDGYGMPQLAIDRIGSPGQGNHKNND